MRSKDLMQRYLFIMNGYNSYMTVNFIAFCMKYLIDLFILFLHILHLFQPLDVNIFAPLKCILVKKIDTIFRFNSNRISRAN